MKMIYIVSYWLPFPHSEYGGVHAVIAENDAECVRILADETDDFYKEEFPNHVECIAEQVAKAKKFPLDGRVRNEGVVYRFIT